MKSTFEAEITTRITSPSSRIIVALDLDVPPILQRVNFKAEGHKLKWLMDGKPIASKNHVQWLPRPARHVVQPIDDGGKVLDEIKIEVLGAGVRAASLTPAVTPSK